jgi:hypothetical protein
LVDNVEFVPYNCQHQKRIPFMFSPEAWFTVAANFQSANAWFNWTLFVVCLLVSGWFIHDFNDGRTHWGAVTGGIFWSAIVSVGWPLAIGAIPILLGLGAVVGVVMLPRWVRVWLHVRKVEKAAMKAMAQSVDKS